MPAGLPKVDINFLLNADGILTIQAIELRSGVKQQVNVKPTYGLKDEEVEQMLLDAVTYAKDDVAQRMVVEAKTEGEQMVYTAKRFLNKNGGFLNADEIVQTQKLIQQLKDCLAAESKDAILNAIETLNEYTRPFAERLMDVAVSQAMKGKAI